MSLFGSIQQAGNTLRATQIGLQVTGQNISNANTPGYIREEVELNAAPTQRLGGVLLGMGVEVKGVVQKIDEFVEQRLRTANSDASASATEQQSYAQLEALIGGLNDTDLKSSLNSFFNSVQDVLTDPTSDASRNLAVLRGQAAAGDINQLATQALAMHQDLNDRVVDSVDQINRLLGQVSQLNVRISQIEGGDVSGSDAVGLRDQRHQALTDLSQLIDIQVYEQTGGAVNVVHQGEYLVSGSTVRSIAAVNDTINGLPAVRLELAETHSQLTPAGGEIAGLINSRDTALGGYLDGLNNLSAALVSEFNRVYSSGQGTAGFKQLTSQSAVTSSNAPLDEAGLKFTPNNGSFEVQLYNRKTGTTERTRVQVDLNGLGDDTTLNGLAASLNAIDGVQAVVTSTNRLQIVSTSPDKEIAFGDDTSGVLASLGLNTFFTGSTATDIAVNQDVVTDPKKFAVSQGGVGADTKNGVLLAGFLDRPLGSQQNATLANVYDRLVNGVTQASAVAHSTADGNRIFQQNLQGQQLAVSGVSIDEETIKLLTFQRSFQATARYISTLNDLMQTLINL